MNLVILVILVNEDILVNLVIFGESAFLKYSILEVQGPSGPQLLDDPPSGWF